MELDRMLKALGEPMRLKIYQALLERKHCVRSLSKKFGISESAISQHMKVMKDAGLVYGEKYGYHTHYLPLQDAVDFLTEQPEKMRIASLTVDRDITVCQCEDVYKRQAPAPRPDNRWETSSRPPSGRSIQRPPAISPRR